MNARKLIVLMTLAFGGTAAMADDITIADDHFVSTKSRAEVRAEVLQARAAGDALGATEMGTTAWPATPSALTREQVLAELLKAPRGQLGEVGSTA